MNFFKKTNSRRIWGIWICLSLFCLLPGPIFLRGRTQTGDLSLKLAPKAVTQLKKKTQTPPPP